MSVKPARTEVRRTPPANSLHQQLVCLEEHRIHSGSWRLTPLFLVKWLLSLGLLVTPALAHNVEVSGDVAGTFHLEPNHNPKAGKPAQVWFALTRKGGQIIPMQQCNCKLAVYSQPRSQDASPLLKPPLRAISAERHQGIPGAEIVFPKAGAYELELNGTPKAGANFKPFKLKYPVTVAGG